MGFDVTLKNFEQQIDYLEKAQPKSPQEAKKKLLLVQKIAGEIMRAIECSSKELSFRDLMGIHVLHLKVSQLESFVNQTLAGMSMDEIKEIAKKVNN